MYYGLYDSLWIFFIYSFLGWCLEVVHFAVTRGRFVNRGFLAGPACPIYGLGVLFALQLLAPVRSSIPLFFIGSVVITTGVEFLIGYVTEKVIHAWLWDYSEIPFNYKGYICLKSSLIWGVYCLFVQYILQPALMEPLTLLPRTAGMAALALFEAVFAADLIVTGADALKLPRQIKAAEEAERLFTGISDAIGEGLADTVFRTMDKRQELDLKLEGYKERITRMANELELAEKLDGYKELLAKQTVIKDLEEKLEKYRTLLSGSNKTGVRWSSAYPRFSRSALITRLEKLKAYYEQKIK